MTHEKADEACGSTEDALEPLKVSPEELRIGPVERPIRYTKEHVKGIPPETRVIQQRRRSVISKHRIKMRLT